VRRTDVEFDGGTGATLRGRILAPDTDRAVPVVMMLTGDGPKGSAGESWETLPRLLAERSIASFVFDFHGLGGSDGSRSDLTLSVGLANARAALSTLKEHDLADIALFGSSFGGNVGVLLASEESTFVALGLKSPVSFYPGSFVSEYGLAQVAQWSPTATLNGLGYGFYTDSLSINTYSSAATIKVPCLITHGDVDTVVPLEQSFHLRAALHSASVDLEVYEGVDHHYSQEGAWDRMASRFVSFFVDRFGLSS
jgi:dipeptidyl aminopeptidase/acylaminoacyl peptidase